MGQQQLLLTILGVIIVGIAVSVGITLYNDNMITQNRDDLQADLAMLAVKADQYYSRPSAMAGGGHSFVGLTADAAGMIKLASAEYANNDRGTYTILAPGSSTLLILRGVGKVQLSDGTFPTYYCRVRDRKYLMLFVN
ncbi:MAG: hypothetical protein WDA22_09910 [Bacteroidota bacterium]